MLIYHPAFDASHCVYRILKIFEKIEDNNSIEIERVKIIDFYMVFPKKIQQIRLTRSKKLSKVKESVKQLDDTYRQCNSPFLIFQKMNMIQDKVLITLVKNEILTFCNENKVYKKGTRFPQNSSNIQLFEDYLSTDDEKEFTDFLYFTPIDGKHGLKSRTNLMEYRYDK